MVGLLDTASQLLGLLGMCVTSCSHNPPRAHDVTITGAAKLPGVLLPLFQQTFILWQLLFGSILLKRRYSVQQLMGVGLVITGASMAAASTQASPGSLVQQV